MSNSIWVAFEDDKPDYAMSTRAEALSFCDHFNSDRSDGVIHAAYEYVPAATAERYRAAIAKAVADLRDLGMKHGIADDLEAAIE